MSSPSLKLIQNESPKTLENNSPLVFNKNTQTSIQWSVQLKKNGSTQEVYIWDSKKPLWIGSPLQWSVEFISKNKILIRNLQNTSESLQNDQHILIDQESLITNRKEIPLPGHQKYTLNIQLKKELKPAFIYQNTENKSLIGFELFTLFGNIIQKSDPFYSTYNLYNKGILIAHLKKTDQNKLEIENGKKELAYEIHNKTFSLSSNEKKQFEWNEIQDLTFFNQNWSWKIAPLYQEHSTLPFKSLHHSAGDFQKEEGPLLKKYSLIISTLFTLGLLFVFLSPSPQVEEKLEDIPPQFAKIILQPKTIQKEVVSQVEDKASPAKTQNQKQAAANQVAIQKAFRNKAVQNNLNKLIKGGMNRVLSQSKILSTTQTNLATGAIYAAPAPTLGNSLLDQVENSNILSVAAVGGEKGAAGGGAGYGTGTSAQVSGQGTGFVDLDFGNAQISKGLTADEVGKVIHKHLREVQYCYESSMMRNPSAEGKMTLDFIIGTTGKVNRAHIKNSNLNDPRLEDCIIKRLVTWPFPRPKGNVEVAISYPFILKALGR